MKRKCFLLRLTPAVHKAAAKHARELGLSLTAYIEQVLRGALRMESILKKP